MATVKGNVRRVFTGNPPAPLSGRVVHLYLRSDGSYVATDTTDGSGNFEFSGLTEGDLFFVVCLGEPFPFETNDLNAIVFDKVAAVGSAHLFWRIIDAYNDFGGDPEPQEFLMIDPSGSDSPWFNISSMQIPPYYISAYELTDNDTGTTSLINTSFGGYLQVEFFSPVEIGGIRQMASNDYRIKSFTLQYSDDGVAWETAGSASNTPWPGTDTWSVNIFVS